MLATAPATRPLPNNLVSSLLVSFPPSRQLDDVDSARQLSHHHHGSRMSTPTTATATLPPYHGGYPFSNPSSYTANSSPYRTNLPAPSRLPPAAYAPYQTSTSTNNTHGVVSNGISISSTPSSSSTSSSLSVAAAAAAAASTSSSRPAYHNAADLVPRAAETNYTTMPVAATLTPGETQPARKRRRSKEPDWKDFYKNGLPKEIIVIDDTPEPDKVLTPPSSSKTAASGTITANAPVTNGTTTTNTAATANTSRHIAKKRKRDDEATHYDPVHNRVVASNPNDTPGSTISSDRTNSAIHTTAATSLGSLSSNGQYDYDAQPGQKRKRTRQQLANEAKKREVGMLGQAYTSYQPPPHPPKKAPDVHVRVVADVSPLLLLLLLLLPITLEPDDGLLTPMSFSTHTTSRSRLTTTTATTLWCRTLI